MGGIRDLCDRGEDEMRSSGSHKQTPDGSAVPAGRSPGHPGSVPVSPGQAGRAPVTITQAV